MTHKHEETTVRAIEPCEHMEQWVSSLSDGSLTGLARLYTRLHILTCNKCRTALHALEKLHHRLGSLNLIEVNETPPARSSERQEALDAALDDIEKKHASHTRA